MNNEVILWAAAVLLIVLAIVLVQKLRGNRKKGAEETKVSAASEKKSAPGRVMDAGTGMSAGTGKEKKDVGSEEKKKSTAGLLYIPPEMTVSGDGRPGYSAAEAAGGTVHLSGAGTESRTDIRDYSGGHGAKSETASLGASSEGGEYSPGDSSTTAFVNHEASPAAEAGRGVVQIYLYQSGTDKWVCPYCELENPGWTSVCQVCGELRPHG